MDGLEETKRPRVWVQAPGQEEVTRRFPRKERLVTAATCPGSTQLWRRRAWLRRALLQGISGSESCRAGPHNLEAALAPPEDSPGHYLFLTEHSPTGYWKVLQ